MILDLTMPANIIEKNSIDIWICQFDTHQEKLDSFFLTLSIDEINRAERFKFKEHRNRFIIFHGFMREVLAKYLLFDPQKINFIKGDKGKPYLSNEHKSTLQFNLSHTQDVALLAIADKGEVGIDIESIDRKTDWQGIAKRFFTAQEYDALFALPEDEQRLAFYDHWTRKEAYMKVLGTGLSLSPTVFSLTMAPQKPAIIELHNNQIH